MMITGRQIREARHMLEWGRAELSFRTAMPVSVIEHAESADGTPGIILDQGNLLRQTFERAGLRFGRGSGVWMSAAEEEVAMPKTLAAEFETRREAEMAVEHLTQEHNIDPGAVSIVPVAAENSAGTEVAGSDNENTGDKAGTELHPALAGKLRVSVEADDALADKVLGSFASYGGRQVG